MRDYTVHDVKEAYLAGAEWAFEKSLERCGCGGHGAKEVADALDSYIEELMND